LILRDGLLFSDYFFDSNIMSIEKVKYKI